MTTAAASPEEQLIDDIASFTHDPLGYALYAFPWGEDGTELAHATGPRKWQADAFREIRDHLQNPATRHQPIMLARASGHGIGKSAFISMLINWGMSTCEDCKVVVTANTDNQLRTKTWPEIIKWSNMAITKEWFTCTATAMYSNDPGHDKRWRADAIPWSEHNTEAFAGLHNERKRIIVVFDEASNIADLVWEVAEGALTGRRHRNHLGGVSGTRRVTPGVSVNVSANINTDGSVRRLIPAPLKAPTSSSCRKWVDDYGEDSDFVKVRVRGIFPDASENQFIPSGLTQPAVGRVITPAQVQHAAVVLGVDPSHQGKDPAVIYLRQGLHCKKLGEWQRTTDDVLFAKVIADFEDQYQADAVFIDYGYGTGLKSVGDNWGRNWTLIMFGSGTADPEMGNKRGEMYKSARDALKLGAQLDSQELADELSAPEYKVRLKDSRKILQDKDEVKELLGRSPNNADAYVLTYAAPVTKKQFNYGQQQSQQGKALTEYDPYA